MGYLKIFVKVGNLNNVSLELFKKNLNKKQEISANYEILEDKCDIKVIASHKRQKLVFKNKYTGQKFCCTFEIKKQNKNKYYDFGYEEFIDLDESDYGTEASPTEEYEGGRQSSLPSFASREPEYKYVAYAPELSIIVG